MEHNTADNSDTTEPRNVESLRLVPASAVLSRSSASEFCHAKNTRKRFTSNFRALRNSVLSSCADCSLRYLHVLKTLGLDDEAVKKLQLILTARILQLTLCFHVGNLRT